MWFWRGLTVISTVCSIVACGRDDTSARPTRAVPPTSTPDQASLLLDHGGQVAPATRTFAIWWGEPSLFPADAQNAVELALRGLADSAYFHVVDEYLRGRRAVTQFAGSFHDAATSPLSVQPSPDEVAAEICRVVDANGILPVSGDWFVVFGSQPATVDTSKGTYCGWHTANECAGLPILLSYIPSPAGSGGLCIGRASPCTQFTPGANGMIITMVHEFMETVTDTLLGGQAWVDASGAEISDKCEQDLGACVELSTGTFQLPRQWSNAQQRCIPP